MSVYCASLSRSGIPHLVVFFFSSPIHLNTNIKMKIGRVGVGGRNEVGRVGGEKDGKERT